MPSHSPRAATCESHLPAKSSSQVGARGPGETGATKLTFLRMPVDNSLCGSSRKPQFPASS